MGVHRAAAESLKETRRQRTESQPTNDWSPNAIEIGLRDRMGLQEDTNLRKSRFEQEKILKPGQHEEASWILAMKT